MSIELFHGLTTDEQHQLLESGRVRMVKAHEIMAREGEPADFAGLVQLGHVKLSRTTPDGTEMILRYLGPGAPFAAIAVLPNATFPVTAIAVTPVRMIVWDAPLMRTLTDRYPQLKTNLMSAMSGHMVGALDRVQELTSERVPQRVAKALLRLAHDSGERTSDGWRIVHPITRQELADLTGTSLFTVSRLVSSWESAGLLRTSRGAMTVVDPAELEQTAENSE